MFGILPSSLCSVILEKNEMKIDKIQYRDLVFEKINRKIYDDQIDYLFSSCDYCFDNSYKIESARREILEKIKEWDIYKYFVEKKKMLYITIY